MKKISLTKEYERDIGLVIEGLWAKQLVAFVPEQWGIEPPAKPFIVFYVTQENTQIWENHEALSWFKDCLLEKNIKGQGFIDKVVSEYKLLLKEIEDIWEGGPTTNRGVLKRYMDLTEKAISLFCAWYYSMIDERNPREIRDSLADLRKTDEFFSRNDAFIKNCTEMLGVDKSLVNFVLPAEFPDLPSNTVLEKRTKGIVSIDGGEYEVITLKKFAASHKNFDFVGLNDNINNIAEIQGQPASGGTAKGIVRIIKNKVQMQSVQKGDIMVSPMTTPDFLPAMKKAAAFITDEGGLTCHAAIVAREMKKPCIIGTKIATKVFKDGQMIEVDADKGIVRIINTK